MKPLLPDSKIDTLRDNYKAEEEWIGLRDLANTAQEAPAENSSNRHTTASSGSRSPLRLATEEHLMKFSHSIRFNAVPDWSSHYIAYSNLKKL